MPETIFDLIDSDIPEGKEGYFELAKNAPQPKEKSFLNDVSDYAKTFLKGGVEGISRLGRIMGPLRDPEGRSNQQIFEQQTEALNELLPTDEGYAQRSIRRGLKEAPTVLASPWAGLQALPRAIAAGFVGEGAKDLGAPEWAQTALELTTQIGPDITKKLLEKGSNKELIEAARKLGLSDEAITPLLQSEFKQKWLSKLVPKRGGTQKALEKTKSELSNAYGTIQKSPEAANVLSVNSQKELLDSFSKKLFNMPSSVRNKVKEDLKDLLSAPVTGETLINFYTDVNHSLGSNTKQLSLLKEPIKKALSDISPKLGEEFDLVNKLYSKYHPIASRLKPTLTSDIIQAAEAIGLGGSIIFGNYGGITGFLIEKAGKKMAQQMLLNPHFQQLSQKMIVAINQNKFGIAKKVIEDLKKEIKKFSPESAEKIQDISEEDFEKMLKHLREKEE